MANILIVAIVVILAATISVFALGFVSEQNQPGPVIGESNGALVGDEAGADDQIIRVTHVAGDTVDVSEMEIVVRVCERTTRVVNLPAPTARTASSPTYFPFDGGNFEGDEDLLTEGTVGQSWSAGVIHEDTDNTFSSGRSFRLRINNGACSLNTGDQVRIQVIHTPTNTVMIRKQLTAT